MDNGRARKRLRVPGREKQRGAPRNEQRLTKGVSWAGNLSRSINSNRSDTLYTCFLEEKSKRETKELVARPSKLAPIPIPARMKNSIISINSPSFPFFFFLFLYRHLGIVNDIVID